MASSPCEGRAAAWVELRVHLVRLIGSSHPPCRDGAWLCPLRLGQGQNHVLSALGSVQGAVESRPALLHCPLPHPQPLGQGCWLFLSPMTGWQSAGVEAGVEAGRGEDHAPRPDGQEGSRKAVEGLSLDLR